MKIKYLTLFLLFGVLSCNDNNKKETVDVFISNGALQCQDNAISVETTTSYLADAGISVLNQSCGIINAGYPSVCGGATGQIHIYSIAENDITNAENIGFTNVSILDDGYQSVDCVSL